jgi:CubicO group peptidase (beta-lactamase class C family)
MRRRAETMPRDQLHGWVAPGFEPVRQAFADNFARRGELGAACAVYRHGEPVVDLWGGLRDRGLSWRQDTLVLVFSVTKGMTATTLAVVHARGLLDYDRPVAAYWPKFAQAGKEAITVRQVLAHQAGLATIDQRLRPVDLADQDRLAALIAGQRPQWAPGTRQGYHYLTSGWIAAELIRRTDPAQRSLGRFFAEEVAAPLGVDFHIGLPPDVPEERVARIKAFLRMRLLLHPRTMPPGMLLAFAAPRSLTSRTFFNPRLASPGAFDHPSCAASRSRPPAGSAPRAPSPAASESWPPMPGPWDSPTTPCTPERSTRWPALDRGPSTTTRTGPAGQCGRSARPTSRPSSPTSRARTAASLWPAPVRIGRWWRCGPAWAERAARPRRDGGGCGRPSGRPGPGPYPGGSPSSSASVSVGECLAASWPPGGGCSSVDWWP